MAPGIIEWAVLNDEKVRHFDENLRDNDDGLRISSLKPSFAGTPMSPRKPKKPTDAELAILRVLWSRGPSIVRDVHRELSRSRTTGYTTVLKHMQIMTDKGLVQRDESVRPQVYEAVRSETQTQRQLLGDLLERAFRSPGNLVLQALSTSRTTPQEREQIRALLDQLERDSR
jgi:predicted transcriptional regulator